MKSTVRITLVLLLATVLITTFNIQPVKAEPTVYVFSVIISDLTFYVIVESNYTVYNFYFDWSNKKIRFNVTGPDGTIGFCNVTIPKCLLRGDPWVVLFDEMAIPFTVTENATHTMLYFSYTHSTHIIEICGTEVLTPPGVHAFRYSPSSPVVNQIVTFNASESYDPDGYIIDYDWDFGDGNKTTTTDPIITHKYIAEGTYDISLTVTDNCGLHSPTMIIPLTVTRPVGGIYTPANKLELSSPYIGLTTLLAVIVTAVGYIKKRKRDTEINS